MAETTDRNPKLGYARDDGSNTTRNLQMGREDRQKLGAAANARQKSNDLMQGEQVLKWKEARQKMGEVLKHEGERVYSQEELRNLPPRPLAALFKEEEAPIIEGGVTEGQTKRRRRRNRGRGKKAGGPQLKEQAARSHSKERIESEMNLQWTPETPDFAHKKGARKSGTPSAPTPSKKLNIKGAAQVMGQTGHTSTQTSEMKASAPKRKRGQRRRRGKVQEKKGGEQTVGEQVAQKGGELAEKAASKMEANKFEGEKVAEKGKEWSEKAGEFIDKNLPKSFEAKQGEKSMGEKVAEKGKEWSEKAGSMMESNKMSGEKIEEKGKEWSKKAGEFVDEKKPKSDDKGPTENVEDYTPFEAVKSMATDFVEQTGHTLENIKDAALSTFGFDTSAETSTAEKRIEEEQDVKEGYKVPPAEGEGVLETAKEMLSNAYDVVKEKAQVAIESVSDAAMDFGLTLEPALAPDTIPPEEKAKAGKSESNKEKRMFDEERMDSQVESVQPI